MHFYAAILREHRVVQCPVYKTTLMKNSWNESKALIRTLLCVSFLLKIITVEMDPVLNLI